MRYIVARWQEDVSWAEGLPADIVQKDVGLPNVGREPTSFLWWIDQHWDGIDPAETYVFVQGNPFDHCDALPDSDVDGFTPLGRLCFTADYNGAPHHPGVPVGEAHERWLGPWSGGVTFWAGGQFAVPGRAILARERDWYRRVFDDTMARDGLWPYALERLWPSIFGGAV